jgi:enoyl-CoA hydratase
LFADPRLREGLVSQPERRVEQSMRSGLRYLEAGGRRITKKAKDLLAAGGWNNKSMTTTTTGASSHARERGGEAEKSSGMGFSTEAGEKEVLYHVEKRVGVLTLNAPARLNAFTMPMALRWKEVVDQIEADLKANSADAPRALVIRGKGSSFCAGGDLKLLASIARSDDLDSNARTLTALYSNFLSIRKLDLPIVAALHGHCVGGGAGIAIGAADLPVAAPNTTMRFNFLRELGITPGMGTTQTLTDVLGSSAQSTQILLQMPKRDLDARELLNRGMVTVVVNNSEEDEEDESETKTQVGAARAGDEAFDKAFELALTLAATNPVAISSITNRRRDLRDILEREGRDQAVSFASPQARKIFSKL